MSDTNANPVLDPSSGPPGGLPEGWSRWAPREDLHPRFEIAEADGVRFLSVDGGGRDFCSGRIERPVRLEGGRTYTLRASLAVPPGVDPHRHLIVALYGADPENGFNDGIFRYRRGAGGRVEGEAAVLVKGEGEVDCLVRIYYRFGGADPIRVHGLWLDPCPAVPARPVRVACTRMVGGEGNVPPEAWEKAIDRAGARGLDLLLLPETFLHYGRGAAGPSDEPMSGPTAALLSRKAAQHGMYMAGTLILREDDGSHFNTGLLYDRRGRLAGRYDKHHPYSPEVTDDGRVPGDAVPVFETDFGRVGMFICYDSWFPDVCELLGLKGAEIALFPNAGYYRSLMPARANDNCMRIVVSSLNDPCGIWDTAGRDVEHPEADETCSAGPERGFGDVERETVEGVEILSATLDLTVSPSAHNWGGPMRSAPGGRRNRRDERRSLAREIAAEQERWLES